MKNEGYAEMFSWDSIKLKEASIKVLKWYASVFSNRDNSRWSFILSREMLPILDRNRLPQPVLFPSEDFYLLFRPSSMVAGISESYRNFAIGIEADPCFEFIEKSERVTPKIRTSFVRANQEIGLEAEEVLGALYQRFPPKIILPRTHFAEKIYAGSVKLFDRTLMNYQNT